MTESGEAPRTEAGRALQASLNEMAELQSVGKAYIKPPARFVQEVREAILSVEREAASAAPQSTPGATGDYYRARREAASAAPLREYLHHLPGCAAGFLWGTEPADECDCGLTEAAAPTTVTSADDWRVSTTHGRYVGAVPDRYCVHDELPGDCRVCTELGYDMMPEVAAPDRDRLADALYLEGFTIGAEPVMREDIDRLMARLVESGSPPLHGHQYGGDWQPCTDTHAGPTPPGEER